jgi:hypothetical protein
MLTVAPLARIYAAQSESWLSRAISDARRRHAELLVIAALMEDAYAI